MVLEIFKSNKSVVGALIVLLTAVLWFPGFLSDMEFSVIEFFPKWLGVLLGLILIGVQAIFLNYIINSNKLLKSSSFLVALFFVLLSSAGFSNLDFNTLIIANTFVLLQLHQLFKLYNQQNANSTIFNLGFFVGIGTILYHPLALLFVLAIIGIAYVRTPNVKDFILLIIGVSVPLIYLAAYFFMTNELEGFYESINHIDLNMVEEESKYFFTYTAIIIFVISFFSLLSSINRSVVKTRKLYVMIILLFIFTASTFLLNYNLKNLYIVLTIPVAVIIGSYTAKIKKRIIGELILIAFIGAILLDYFL